jgi:hypothetical protein
MTMNMNELIKRTNQAIADSVICGLIDEGYDPGKAYQMATTSTFDITDLPGLLKEREEEIGEVEDVDTMYDEALTYLWDTDL